MEVRTIAGKGNVNRMIGLLQKVGLTRRKTNTVCWR